MITLAILNDINHVFSKLKIAWMNKYFACSENVQSQNSLNQKSEQTTLLN